MRDKQLSRSEAFYFWVHMEPVNKRTSRIMGKLYRIFGGSRSKLYRNWAKKVK